MTRVLHLRSGSGLYGADRALLALAGATPAPFEPVVGSMIRVGLPDALGDEARARGLAACTFRSTGKLDLPMVRAIKDEIRAQGVSLLHAHDFKSLWVALLAGLSTGVPVVATYHGETRVTVSVRAYELFARVLGNFTRGVVAVSRSLERTLGRWVRLAPVTFVPNGLPARAPPTSEERHAARAALGLPEDAYAIAVIGRLSPEKGHAVLLEAARALKPAPVLLFAGDGPLRKQLEAQAAGLDVRFLGFLHDTRQVFAAADVVALPSLTEGLPLVALEALTARRCVVASRVGELPELLANGAGVLVNPGDASALQSALESVRTPAAREAIAAAGLLRVAAYDVHAMASEYSRAYRAALPASSRGALPSSSR